MASSYTQLAWHAVKRSSRPSTVSDIDNVTSALRNLLVIFNIFAWIKWPLILLVALLSWLIPITTVIAPATLTVSQGSALPEMRDVPSVAYTSANMFTVSTISSGDQYLQLLHDGQFYTASYDYQGPSDAVSLLAITVGTQGIMLPVTPPAPNSNWNSSFFGPSIRCRNVSAGLRNAISLDIATYMNDSMFQHKLHVQSAMNYSALNPLYFAWTPSVPSNLSPDDPSFKGYVQPLRKHEYYEYDISDRRTGEMAPLYVAVIPSAITLLYPGKAGEFIPVRWDRNTTLPQVIEEYIDPGLTLLQCDLHNATYDVRYNFSAGLQTMESTVLLLSDEPFRIIDLALGFTPKSDYEDFIAAPEVGQELPAPADCQGLWNASSGTQTTCAFDANVLAKFSNQAVWDAFTQLSKGGLYADISTFQPTELKETDVANTVLARSTELKHLVELVRRKGDESLQQNLVESYSNVPGMYGTPGEIQTQPLSSMLEELFRNITLSLASLSELQPNKSSPYRPPQSKVTFTATSPLYEYSSSRLWLAYGLAIAMTTLIVIAGLTVMYISSAAYTNSFSTTLRLARGAHLSQKIVGKDYDGKEPLPEYLEKATISFAGSALWGQDAHGDSEYELIPVCAPEPVTKQESPDWHADSYGQLALQSSTEEGEGNEVNERSPKSSAGSSAESLIAQVEEVNIGPPSRPGSRNT